MRLGTPKLARVMRESTKPTDSIPTRSLMAKSRLQSLTADKRASEGATDPSHGSNVSQGAVTNHVNYRSVAAQNNEFGSTQWFIFDQHPATAYCCPVEPNKLLPLGNTHTPGSPLSVSRSSTRFSHFCHVVPRG